MKHGERIPLWKGELRRLGYIGERRSTWWKDLLAIIGIAAWFWAMVWLLGIILGGVK